jgi:hypothetical protein
MGWTLVAAALRRVGGEELFKANTKNEVAARLLDTGEVRR